MVKRTSALEVGIYSVPCPGTRINTKCLCAVWLFPMFLASLRLLDPSLYSALRNGNFFFRPLPAELEESILGSKNPSKDSTRTPNNETMSRGKSNKYIVANLNQAHLYPDVGISKKTSL